MIFSLDTHNIHLPFSNLILDEENHVYYRDNQKVPISVSGLVKQHCPVVDFNAIAKRSAHWRGKTVEQIKAEWKLLNDESLEKGNETHDYAEFHVETQEPDTISKKIVKRFFDNLPSYLVPVYKEFKLYSEKYNYAGMVDLLLYDLINDVYHIFDWKTNKDLHTAFGTLNPPFNFMGNSNFNKYQLQLNLYELALAEQGIKIGNKAIVWINDKKNRYEIEYCASLTQKLEKWLMEK